MPTTRHFLDWNTPVTQGVSDFLLPDTIEPLIDFSSTITVVPTRQAGRRLSEALVRRCAEHGASLLSSRIVTPAFFLQPEHPDPEEADAMTVKIAWAHVLEASDANSYPGMFPPGLLQEDPEWAAQTGDLIQRLRQTLSDGAMRIADVIQTCGTSLPEPERWHDLQRLEQAYLEKLASLERQDPVINRIDKSGTHRLPESVDRIVLAVVPDPSELLVRAISRTGHDVDILVHARHEDADRFDDWGRPLPEAWISAAIDIPDPEKNILLTGSPADQADAVTSILSDGDFSIDDSALGVPDDAVAPFIESELEKYDITAFDPADQEVRDHPVYGLLDAFSALIIEGNYRDLARILRHPDLLARLSAAPEDAEATLTPRDILESLDTFQNECLPVDFDDVLRAMNAGRGERYPALRTAVRFLDEHLTAIRKSDAESALRAFLRDIYSVRTLGNAEIDGEFETVATKCEHALRELAEAPLAENGDPALPLRLFLHRLGEESYHRARHESQLDLEGWIELPWNDAPQMIITGLNEGIIPDGRVSDIFLPDSLRQQLSLRDDARRLARDAYVLSSCIQARQSEGRVILIAGKTSSTGDPLKPSRLLFRCPDACLAERAATLFGPAESTRPNTPATIAFKLDSALPEDLPSTATDISSLSVTEFRDYLACPFRFYLSHVLDMEHQDDEKTDLDALDFGNLVHDALHQMAGCDVWHCGNEDQLSAFLSDCAERWILAHYEGARALPVRIALDAARQRLGAAARVQVALVNEGWQIEASEVKYRLSLNDLEITGKVDRLDRHAKTGRLRIIDYKSSDNESTPEEAHLRPAHAGAAAYSVVSLGKKVKRWIDLQLPLYRHLVSDAEDTTHGVDLAYFNLPKAVSDTGLKLWDGFPDTLQDSALACAAAVIDEIRKQQFWPPAEGVLYDNFAELFFGEVTDCATKPR